MRRDDWIFSRWHACRDATNHNEIKTQKPHTETKRWQQCHSEWTHKKTIEKFPLVCVCHMSGETIPRRPVRWEIRFFINFFFSPIKLHKRAQIDLFKICVVKDLPSIWEWVIKLQHFTDAMASVNAHSHQFNEFAIISHKYRETFRPPSKWRKQNESNRFEQNEINRSPPKCHVRRLNLFSMYIIRFCYIIGFVLFASDLQSTNGIFDEQLKNCTNNALHIEGGATKTPNTVR